MHTVLVVDDDADLRNIVRFALKKSNYTVVEASHGVSALEMWASTSPDLIVLDITMPEMDGTEVCREIRKTSDVPIIFLTSRDDEIDRVLGLEMGADDYMTKPFSPRELVARVKAVLRRLETRRRPERRPKTNREPTIQHGRVSVDEALFKAFWDDREITLTATEFGILKTLLRRPGKVYSRNELMDRAYATPTIVSDRTIDSHVTRIRRKFAELGGHPIETVHGIGYKCNDCLS